MADDNDDDGLAPEKRLERVLESRWDPSKLSRFLKGSSSSRGQKLDASHRSRFEGRFGVGLGDVRIFTGELAEEITKAHGAEALTVGDTGMILMRESTKFQKGSADYTALLAHELTHVAQARPDAVARRTTASQAHVDASEAEAEKHEEEVYHEERGGGDQKPSSKTSPTAKEGKKDKLLERVLQLMEDEAYINPLRSGS